VILRVDAPPVVLAPSLEDFFARYLELAKAGRIRYDAKVKRMVFEGEKIERAFLG
jgi:hypothetical protein